MTTKALIFLILFLPASIHAEGWRLIGEIGSGGKVVSLICLDSNDCFALNGATGKTTLSKSSDQGKSWEPVFTYNGLHGDTPWLFNPREGAAPHLNHYVISYSDYGDLLKSSDGGKTFKRVRIGESSTLTPVAMLDTNTGFVIFTAKINDTTYRQRMYVTFDGWKTFQLRDVPYRGAFYSTQRIDDKNVRMLYNTSDYGGLVNFNIYEDKWTKLYEVPRNPDTNAVYHDQLMKFTIINDTLGFGAGDRRTGYGDQKRDLIYMIANGGQSLQKIWDNEHEPKFGLTDIAFYDEMNGLAVGTYGKTLMTRDGGKTWVYDKLSSNYAGPDTVYGPMTVNLEWAGRTPLVGTFGGYIYRYEGDFFHFVDPTQLISPENGSIKTDTAPTFMWKEVPGMDSYILQIASDSGFTDIIRQDTMTQTQKTVSGLKAFTGYYWRVASTKGANLKWTEAFAFRTKLAKAVTLSPECGAFDQETDAELSWSEVSGAEFYRLELAETDIFDILKISEDSIAQTTFTAETLDSGTTYYWRVQAFNAQEQSGWSEICGFTTDEPTSVAEFPSSGVRVFHNNRELRITISENNRGTYHIHILDLLGKTVYEENIGSISSGAVKNIDLSGLGSGIYLYKITGNDKTVQRGKFNVMR